MRVSHFETYGDKAGEYRWRLVDTNGRTIADSGEGYTTAAHRDAAIENARIEIQRATIRPGPAPLMGAIPNIERPGRK